MQMLPCLFCVLYRGQTQDIFNGGGRHKPQYGILLMHNHIEVIRKPVKSIKLSPPKITYSELKNS
jgi:hypothetical protein